MNLNPLDIIFLILMVVFVIRGLLRGFVVEFSSVAAIFLSILIAVLFSGLAAQLLDKFLEPSFWNQVIAFLALFMLTYLLVKLFEAGLKNLVSHAKLENLDRALGLFLGLIEGLLVVFILLFVLYVQPLFPVADVIAESFFGELLSPLFPYAAEFIIRGADV